MSHHSAEEAANAMSSPAASSLAAAGSAISAATSGSHSGARGRLSCGLRFGKSQAGSLGCCQRSIVPSSWTIVRNGTPDVYSAHIAAFAERHTHHCAPARNSASRAARCDGLHWPRRDFSSIVIDLPRYQISTSGTPGLTPRFLRIAPLVTDGATGSVAVQNVQAGSSPFVEEPSEFHLLPPFLAACHDHPGNLRVIPLGRAVGPVLSPEGGVELGFG